MKAMCGRLRLDKGDVRVEGKDPRLDQNVRRMVSYVPQDIAIFPYLTVIENLEIFGQISGLLGVTSLNQLRECYKSLSR